MSRISALALLIFTLTATEANAQQVGLQNTQEMQLLKKLGIITSSNSINSSNTGYVDPNSTASGTNSYKTIQSAINAGFSTIEVGPGTYTENLTLKPNILLVGNNTTISGNITYAPTGGNLVDVAYLKNLKVTGTISCDYTGKTGNSSYGFLDIRSCQFPTLTCLARAGLGNDGVSVQDFVFDTLPETFDFTCTNGFFDLEHAQINNLDSEGDAFGNTVVANISGTTTINSNGGLNFYQGIISGNVNVSASKGTALHLFQTSVKSSTITIGSASTVIGTATRLTGSSSVAGAGTYDPDTNLVAGSGITINYAGDKATIVNASPGTTGTIAQVLAAGNTTDGLGTHNLQVASGDLVKFLAGNRISLQLTPTDASAKLFNIGTGDFSNTGGSRHDSSFTVGYNIDPTTGGKQSAGENAQGLVFEAFYNPSGTAQTEAYLNIIFPSSTTQYRPFSYVGILDGSETLNVAICGSKIQLLTKDAATPVFAVQPNSTASSTVTDIEGVLENDTNNVIWLKQKNAAANAFIPLLYLDSTNIIRLDPNFVGLQIGGNSRFYVDANGNVITRNSGSLATNATNGWLYIPQSAGSPTGTPASLPSGDVPEQYDYLGHQRWVYDQNSATGWLNSPTTIFNQRLTGRTATTTFNSLQLNAQEGSYLLTTNINVTAYTAGTLTETVAYTDESNGGTARVLTLNLSSIGGTLTTTASAAGAYEGVPLRIRAKTGTTIQATVTGTAFTGTFNMEFGVMQVQ